ncbi:type I-E CRISPR-associated protein Cas7/Cse4/CasC, partial [Loigolactobacillus coryniformis]|uniref:type I-E CRISPR-associated protein Cas7/Cse4/CasC n=1 Tax=Loigolactobacillus coryniformis TaxID=1610 RepID=UPI00201A90B9
FAMVEHGIEQPRSLINAFLSAVDPRKGLLPATYQALASHLREQEAMYGTGEARAHAGMGQLELLEGLAGPRRSLSELMEA